MADSPDSLPLAEPPPDDQALLARAFWLLLDHGHPSSLTSSPAPSSASRPRWPPPSTGWSRSA
jgi:hypothetical protein